MVYAKVNSVYFLKYFAASPSSEYWFIVFILTKFTLLESIIYRVNCVLTIFLINQILISQGNAKDLCQIYNVLLSKYQP